MVAWCLVSRVSCLVGRRPGPGVTWGRDRGLRFGALACGSETLYKVRGAVGGEPLGSGCPATGWRQPGANPKPSRSQGSWGGDEPRRFAFHCSGIGEPVPGGASEEVPGSAPGEELGGALGDISDRVGALEPGGELGKCPGGVLRDEPGGAPVIAPGVAPAGVPIAAPVAAPVGAPIAEPRNSTVGTSTGVPSDPSFPVPGSVPGGGAGGGRNLAAGGASPPRFHAALRAVRGGRGTASPC